MPIPKEKRTITVRELAFIKELKLVFGLDSSVKNRSAVKITGITGVLCQTAVIDTSPNFTAQGVTDSVVGTFELTESDLGLTPAQLRNLINAVETALDLKTVQNKAKVSPAPSEQNIPSIVIPPSN